MADFIVAIELGSSKMTGIAGRKNLDGSINVLAVVKEDSTDCIRKGIVYNIDKTAQALMTIVKKLENNLKTKITHVYVGVGGQSIRSVKSVNVKNLPVETTVSQDMINENRGVVWFVEKNKETASSEYARGDSFGLHKNLSLYNSYRIGRLGAKPELGSIFINLED